MKKKVCGRKIRYETEEKARNVVKNLGHLWSKKSHVYKCPFGDHWHLTTHPRMKRDAK